MMLSKILKTLSATIVAVIVVAAGVFADVSDTAYVPFKINVNAIVWAVHNDDAVNIYVRGGEVDTLKLPLEKTVSVLNTGRTQGRLNAPTITASRGNITLRLPAQSYQNAEVALYSVNGKRILRGKAAATDAASSVSRRNVAAGVYLLSVKGISGNAFTTRLTHSGGKMNINVAFGVENVSPARQTGKKADTEEWDWEITVQATSTGEYEDFKYTLYLSAGQYQLQDIVLVKYRWMTGNLGGNNVFYTWSEALTACPAGWHLPTDAEWSTFPTSTVTFAGNTVGGVAIEVGSYGSWWTATESSYGDAWARYAWRIAGDTLWGRVEESKSKKLSVRCVRNPVVTYTIIFDAAGGTVTPTSDTTDENGKLTSLPTPTRSGYTFNGWYTAATGGTTVTEDRVYTADTTIYAQWTGIPTPTQTTFTDDRDDREYKKVTIGTQTWMAENLNYAGDDEDNPLGVCYNNSADSCAKYGRLYDWVTAMNNAAGSSANPSKVQGACPVGWHLPSYAEWTALITFIGGTSTAETKLKAASGWAGGSWVDGSGGVHVASNNGTDDYGFSALPGGYVGSNGNVYDAGFHGYWWGATEYDVNSAVSLLVCTKCMVDVQVALLYQSNISKSLLYSVRCVQD